MQKPQPIKSFEPSRTFPKMPEKPRQPEIQRTQIQSGPTSVPVQFPNPLQSIPTQSPASIAPAVQIPQIHEEQSRDKYGQEFEKLVKEKLGRFDEVVEMVKGIQESMKKPETPIYVPSIPQQPMQHSQISVEAPKNPRTKRTYYPVTNEKWDEIKKQFPELSDDKRPGVFSDGEKNYIEFKNKKIELNYKAILKMANNK